MAGGPAPTSVILISWDGARYDTLRELMHWQPITEVPRDCPARLDLPKQPMPCGQYWSCLPAICQFQVVESHVISGKTLTRVQHASMLSGQPPEVTGIQSNNGSGQMPPGMVLYELLHAHDPSMVFGHVGSIRYTVEGILNGARPDIILDENVLSRGGPDNYTGLGANEQLLPVLRRFAGQPFFLFQHQKGTDWAGHRIGDRTIQYREAMMRTDERLAELLAELETLGIAETTHVYITTDHGFRGRQHLGDIRQSIARTWFASRDNDLRCFARGTVLDVVPTILETYGIDPETITPELPGRSFLADALPNLCVPPVCGSGGIEPGEDCDGSDLAGQTCESLGFLRGTLSCSGSCFFDTSDCADTIYKAQLSVDASANSVDLIDLKVTDPERGGPEFDPAVHTVGVELLDENEVSLWRADILPPDEGWALYNNSATWSADRDERPDGLVSVRMADPDRKMRLYLRGVRTDIEWTGRSALRVILRLAGERLDIDMTCTDNVGGGISCKWQGPREAKVAPRHVHSECEH